MDKPPRSHLEKPGRIENRQKWEKKKRKRKGKKR